MMNKLLILTLVILGTSISSQAQSTFSFQDLKNWWGGTTTAPISNGTRGALNDIGTNPSGTTVILGKVILTVGQEMVTDEKKYSANNEYFIIIQTDGHICIYKASNTGFVWGTGTNGRSPGGKLILQTDGHLVFYGTNNQVLWASGTYGGQYNEAKYKPTKMVLENDGVLSLYSDTNYKVWTSTGGKLPLN
jgi:hypothetical protein